MKVGIYIRCASPNQAEFDEQRNRCTVFATQAGHEVVAVFEDFGKSGLDKQRPGLQAMLAAAQAGAFDALIIDQLYRLSRDDRYIWFYMDFLKNHNVSLIIPNKTLIPLESTLRRLFEETRE